MIDPKYRYHHIGIPTSIPRKGEHYLPDFGMYHQGYEQSKFGIEWIRFDESSLLPDLVKEVAHVAFEVDDLDEAIRGLEILIQPNSPSDGVKVAFVLENGAPVEILQFKKSKSE